MQKLRIKLQIILGMFLLITAFAEGKSTVSYASLLPPFNFVSAMPVKAATVPSPIEGAQYTSIIYCSTCHESINAMKPVELAQGYEQTVPLEDHSERIVQCVFCHTETPEMNISQMGEPE